METSKPCWHCQDTKLCDCMSCGAYSLDGTKSGQCRWCAPKAPETIALPLLVIGVKPELIEAAKQFRAGRDNWKNVATKNDTRWVGDLGEVVFHQWLKGLGIKHWWDPRANKKYDIVMHAAQIELKTMTRQGYVREGYTHSVNALQIKAAKTDHWFFLSFNERESMMTLVGGCTHKEFETFRIYREGERVHQDYTVQKQEGGFIRNVEYDKLVTPEAWLAQFKAAPAGATPEELADLAARPI